MRPTVGQILSGLALGSVAASMLVMPERFLVTEEVAVQGLVLRAPADRTVVRAAPIRPQRVHRPASVKRPVTPPAAITIAVSRRVPAPPPPPPPPQPAGEEVTQPPPPPPPEPAAPPVASPAIEAASVRQKKDKAKDHKPRKDKKPKKWRDDEDEDERGEGRGDKDKDRGDRGEDRQDKNKQKDKRKHEDDDD